MGQFSEAKHTIEEVRDSIRNALILSAKLGAKTDMSSIQAALDGTADRLDAVASGLAAAAEQETREALEAATEAQEKEAKKAAKGAKGSE